MDLPSLSRLARGPAPGLIAVSLFCLGLLVVSFRVSDNYYARRLVAADSSYYLMSASLVVSGGNDFAFRRLLEHPAPLVTSDGGTTVYVLHTLAAWWLRAVLPLRPAMAVVLNGVWLVTMALSVYALLWSRLRSWATATFVTIAYVLANPFFPSTTFGITSLDPNLGAFMLGTSALCWTVLSDRFQRAIPCLLVGLFLGFLCLARIYSLGVIGPAMLPYVVACFWRRPWREIWRSTQGGLLALGTAFVVGGWFVRANWQQLLKYPTQYGTAGVLNHTPLSEGIWAWLKFPRSVLAENLTLVCVMSWPLAVAVFGRERSLRHFNWSGLCAALAPLVVLAKMGTTFQPYGAASLFGVFMVLLFPFAGPDPSLLYRGRFAAALSLACAFSCWSSFGNLHEAHSAPKDNKRGTVAALESLRDDALRAERKRVTVGLVHWGTLHDASLVDSLVMDLKVRVATPDFRPRKRAATPLIVTTLATDPWAWDPEVAGAAVITPAAWTERIVQEADYVFVLAGDRKQDHRRGRWPPWMEACDLIRESGVFRRLGAPFYAGSDGRVELLVRKEARRR